MTSLDERSQNELLHGRQLVESGDPETAWSWTTAAGQVRAQRRAELISESVGLAEGMRVLEIGCGTGLFTELFSKSDACILAVDISPDLLRIAKQRGLNPELVEFREMRFEDSELQDSFDAIIGSSVLHHLELEIALQNIFRLLKPGGVMAFAEPNMMNPQIWAERNIKLVRGITDTSPDESAIVARRLNRDLRKAGLTEVSIQNFDWLHPLTPRVLIKPVSTLGLVLERIPLLRSFSGSVLIRGERPD